MIISLEDNSCIFRDHVSKTDTFKMAFALAGSVISAGYSVMSSVVPIGE